MPMRLWRGKVYQWSAWRMHANFMEGRRGISAHVRTRTNSREKSATDMLRTQGFFCC